MYMCFMPCILKHFIFCWLSIENKNEILKKKRSPKRIAHMNATHHKYTVCVCTCFDYTCEVQMSSLILLNTLRTFDWS